jgi:threonine/homoserine/homoserine lactone efflux protein
VAGGSGLARHVHVIADPLHVAAGVMLAGVAAWMALAALRRYRTPATGVDMALRSPLRAYATLAAVTVLNPLTLVYWAALIQPRRCYGESDAPSIIVDASVGLR